MSAEGAARPFPIALTIAGSDSGGGAGIQADLKTFAALGVHGLSAITAVTAQNTLAVESVFPIPAQVVGAQIDAVARDLRPMATKTGMLGSAGIVEVVAAKVREHALSPLVIDPVLAATTGVSLLDEDAIEVLRARLLPLAAVVTPNLAEASILCGFSVESLDDMREAARGIRALGASAVVVTGGHLRGSDTAVDVLLDDGGIQELSLPRLDVSHTHGTGCVFSAAIAARLARGFSLRDSVAAAKGLVHRAIELGLPIGGGAGPVDPIRAAR